VHDAGIVHRDIKPANVFLTRDGRMKLLDFGIACRAGRSPQGARHGAVVGTPSYAAPEQASGRVDGVDVRSDIWSVGAIAFTLLSGRLVHSGTAARETMALAAKQHAPRLATVAPDVLPQIAHIVDRALAFDREERWPDAASMHAAILDARVGDAPRSRARLRRLPSAAPTLVSPVGTVAPPRPLSVHVLGDELSATRGREGQQACHESAW
jgi:serine/threonine-protein kinase